jgi:HEAT repeat protein
VVSRQDDAATASLKLEIERVARRIVSYKAAVFRSCYGEELGEYRHELTKGRKTCGPVAKLMKMCLLVGLLVVPATLWAGADAPTKKYPPYPDVWGYELPAPADGDRNTGMDVARMPDGDYVFTYVTRRDVLKQSDGSCCEIRHNYGAVSFFSGKRWKLSTEEYNEFWKKHHTHRVSFNRTSVSFPDGSSLIQNHVAYGCYHAFPYSLVRKDSQGNEITSKTLVYNVPSPRPHDIHLCEGEGDTSIVQHVEAMFVKFVPLEDGSLLLYEPEGNVILRFDKDLNTKYKLNERVFLLDSRPLFLIAADISRGVSYRDSPQAINDAVLNYVLAVRTGIVPEPTYGGHTYAQWIEILQHGSPSARREAIDSLGRFGKSALPALIEVLHDSAPEVRASAVTVIGRMDPKPHEAIPELTRLLKDENEKVRQMAAWSLGLIQPRANSVLQGLISALSDPSRDTRTSAASSIGRLGPPAKEAVPALLQALQDSDNVVRSASARALGQIGQEPDRVVPALVRALGDQGPYVAEAARHALSAFGGASLPPLIKLFAHENPKVRREAISATGELGKAASGAVPRLAEMLKDPDRNVRIATLRALSMIQPPEEAIGPIIAQALSDPDAQVRHQAAFEITFLPIDAAIIFPALVKALKDQDHAVRFEAAGAMASLDLESLITRGVRIEESVSPLRKILVDDRSTGAAMALAHIGSAAKDAVPELILALREALKGEAEQGLGEAAAKALGSIGPSASNAVPILVQALRGPEMLDYHSAVALGRIGTPAVPALIKALGDPKVRVRESAAFALGEIGPSAKAAIPILEKISLQDKDQVVRKSAVSALKKIKGE